MTEMLTFAMTAWISHNEVDLYTTGHYSGRWGSDPWLDRWSPTQSPTPQSLDTNTHTLLREGPTGHETHQWRLSTSSHSNVTIKKRSKGQPPTSKWCLSALTPLSTLFIHPNIIFFFFYSFQSWLAMLCYHFIPLFFHYHSCSALFDFLLLSADFPWPHSHLDYEGGERNIRRTKMWEHLHEMRRSSWKNSLKQVCWILNTKKSVLGCGKSLTTAEGWGVIVLMHKDIIAFMIEEECLHHVAFNTWPGKWGMGCNMEYQAD